MLLKAMGESFILSKDEPLTPNIDGDMALWFFRRRAQNTKIGRRSATLDLLILVLIFVAPAPLSVCAQFFQGPHRWQTKPLENFERLGPF